ncbi:lethal(3)malignant brain tumor-like protein 4 isoform X2 [Tribolium castaneum]|uniref:lethal(3)malignant brain tumor-like protein 4 isoform X2 n=1 Tax=Tribolium castaneum TaxID=7070 RepID=UPI0030FEAC1A
MSSGASESGEAVQTLPELDTTTSENSIISSNPMKTQVVPLVYIQTQSKLPFSSITKPNMVNTQLQFATLPNIVNKTPPNQGVILTPVKNVPKGQQLVIHKPSNMQTVTLSSGTYLTMIKPLTKLSETKSEPGKKLMIAPMPKVIKNRLPVTVTTNTLQPKIAFMPLLPANNVKVQEDSVKEEENNLVCDEVIDLDSPVKSEKEYELSILEDSNSFSFEDKRKEIPKFTKHGVSILKKNYQGEKPRNSTTNTNQIVDPDPVKLQKTERRRKSNFSYRKDYDDMEIVESKEKFNLDSDVTLTKLEDAEHFDKKHVKDDFLEIEVIKEKKTDINMNDDFDLQKILKWDEGIGSLPGSDLKFIVNEFNLIEYVTTEEYNKIIEKRLAKVNKVKNEFQEELRCVECGCYGLPSEFITSKYCSLDCQDAGNNKQMRDRDLKIKKKKKKGGGFPLKKIESDPLSGSDDDTSNENSQDKFSYPWTCSKKGFSWTKYLDHIKAKAAPVKLFKDPFPYTRNGFRPGMKLEGIDPQHPSYYCVLTVAEICGYRVRLHFDGYPENYDFWANADSMDIFPVGWCEKHGRGLQAPPGYTSENFNWVAYLKQTKSTAAPKHLFANRAGNTICPNGFRVGMKLEAVDKKNSSLVCVATVKDMMDNRILVHFDSWDDIYDYWADPTSPYIHPVGWCDQYGHNLTPPNDYPNPETFSWAKYLKETKAVAAPVRAFKQRPACGFKRGMRLECVDKRVPQLIRVATVDDVRDHQIRIHFDGWPDRYSYWVDDDHEDIHPVGWCQKTGHPIETPLTPDDVYDFLECPTVGCRGMGHIQGPKFATHSEQKYCPYAEDNIDVDRVLPDRLLTPDRLVEAVVPVSREPRDKIKPRLGRPPKYLKLENNVKEPEEEVKKPKRKYRKRIKRPIEEEEEEEQPDSKIRKIESLMDEANVEPAVKETWDKHSRFLQEYVEDVGDPLRWSVNVVSEFVSTLPGLEHSSDHFRNSEIDGDAFLSLNQRDLIDILHVKVGPAIKLYNVIVLLRRKVRQVRT